MKSISFKNKFEKQVAETINSNEEVRHAINNVVEDRFDRILEEMRAEREENHRQWEENHRKLEENDRKWDVNQKQWEENNRKWEENQKNINEILASIKIVEINHQKLYDLFTQTVGSLGARWGTRSEQSFRNALKGILEETTNYKVENVIEDDREGVVFGWPAQVELDVVIINGKLFIIEIKSSMSGGDVATFVKKAKFYLEKHNKKANALVVISPMMDEKANEFIKDRGIIAYSYASDLEAGSLG
ncbi:MAG: DUF3782 domain-containing protein [Desulfomonilaceae bacterium]|jgi:hypothetical protein